MAKDSSTLLLLGGGALAVWYGYTQGWFASLGFAPAAAASTPTPVTPAMPAAASTVAPVSTSTAVATIPTALTPAASTPSYGGASLASMLSALQAQLAQNAGDPALSSSGGTVSAVCDVFNYYLVAAGVGVSDGMLQCSDHSTVMTVAQYWAWAAPQLQTKIPGLSGLGNVYAGLGWLARQAKGGW